MGKLAQILQQNLWLNRNSVAKLKLSIIPLIELDNQNLELIF